jgi:hypothetical protein
MAADLTRLRGDLRRYRERYGLEAVPTDRTEIAVRRRRTRMEYLEAQIEELQSEWQRLNVEISGLERGLVAALTEQIDRIRREQHEAWSPSPVLGFRIWFADDDGLHGARVAWPTPELTAHCERRPSDDVEVPHTDGRCGRLGCGIYATKEARPVIVEHIPPGAQGWVAGLVELSGKVVEHDHGYRAARARVVAVAAVGRYQTLWTADPGEISGIFAHPGGVLGGPTSRRMGTEDAIDAVVAFLEDELQRRTNSWTSESSSG